MFFPKFNCWPDTAGKKQAQQVNSDFENVLYKETILVLSCLFPHLVIITFCILYAYHQIKRYFCTVSCRDAGFVERTLGHGDAEALEVLGGVLSSLEDMEAGGQRPTSWGDCVSWARCQWETLYNNNIRQLLHCFPSEQVKSHHRTNNNSP